MLRIYHIGAKQLKTVMKDRTVFSLEVFRNFLCCRKQKCFHAGSHVARGGHVVDIVDNAHNVTVDRISKVEMTN